MWRASEGPEGQGGLRDRPLRAAGSRVAISRAAGPDGAQNISGATSNKTARPGHRRARLRHPWAAAGPGRASRRRAERSSQRGRLAGGPPPTGTPSSPATRPGPTAPRTSAVPQATKQQGQGVGGPGCGTHGRRRGLAGLRGDTQPRKRRRCGGCRRVRRARLRCPWAVAGPGRASRGSSTTHSDTSAAGVEGAGGFGGQGRASRSTTPSRRLACGDLAGGRTRRCPEHQRRHTQREPDTRKPRPADAGRGQPTQSGGKV